VHPAGVGHPGVQRTARQAKRTIEPTLETLMAAIDAIVLARPAAPSSRIAVNEKDGRTSGWLARWLTSRGVETHVIGPTSVPVVAESRPKSDGIDAELLLRILLA
jgi:hypothetical protein